MLWGAQRSLNAKLRRHTLQNCPAPAPHWRFFYWKEVPKENFSQFTTKFAITLLIANLAANAEKRRHPTTSTPPNTQTPFCTSAKRFKSQYFANVWPSLADMGGDEGQRPETLTSCQFPSPREQDCLRVATLLEERIRENWDPIQKNRDDQVGSPWRSLKSPRRSSATTGLNPLAVVSGPARYLVKH